MLVFTMMFMCDILDCGTEAEEGWEMVQRPSKTKFRPSPISGPLSQTSVLARQADGDGRTFSQTRHKEGSCRANVAASKQTHMAVTYVKKQQQCSVSALEISGNSSNFTKSPVNTSQQSKNSSHISTFSSSRGNRGTKSSPKLMPLPLTTTRSCTETMKSETCLKTAEISMVDATRETGSKLCENSRTEEGDNRLNAGTAESDLHNCVGISGTDSHHSAVTQAGSSNSKPSVSIMDVTVTHNVSSRTSSSMTEVRHIESADIQQSSSDSDRQSFHLCRKSVSDDTLMERVTVSGDNVIITLCLLLAAFCDS